MSLCGPEGRFLGLNYEGWAFLIADKSSFIVQHCVSKWQIFAKQNASEGCVFLQSKMSDAINDLVDTNKSQAYQRINLRQID